jgi:hypothetical protein
MTTYTTNSTNYYTTTATADLCYTPPTTTIDPSYASIISSYIANSTSPIS